MHYVDQGVTVQGQITDIGRGQRTGAGRLPDYYYDLKCTKHQFIHVLTATFKDLHIENSKNYKR